MKAKYNSYCKITNQPIIAGETEIVKINGQWQCAKAESQMAKNDRIKDAVFASEMQADGFDDYYMELEAENDRYEAKKSAAAQRLHAQFPDTPASKWLAAIEAATAIFAKPVQFTSEAKSAAFEAEIANL